MLPLTGILHRDAPAGSDPLDVRTTGALPADDPGLDFGADGRTRTCDELGVGQPI